MKTGSRGTERAGERTPSIRAIRGRRISTKTTDPLAPSSSILLYAPTGRVFIKASKRLAFICSCDVSVKPAGFAKMIDVRSIPFRGAIGGPIGAEERRDRKESGRDGERALSIREAFLVSGRERPDEEERGSQSQRERERLEHPGRGIPRDVLMVLEIENAPGQPKWVWLPSLVPIISVGWNFEAKWRACGNADDRNYVASSCLYRPIEFLSGDRPSVSSFHRAPRHFFIGVDINLSINYSKCAAVNRRTLQISNSRNESYRTLEYRTFSSRFRRILPRD